MFKYVNIIKICNLSQEYYTRYISIELLFDFYILDWSKKVGVIYKRKYYSILNVYESKNIWFIFIDNIYNLRELTFCLNTYLFFLIKSIVNIIF